MRWENLKSMKWLQTVIHVDLHSTFSLRMNGGFLIRNYVLNGFEVLTTTDTFTHFNTHSLLHTIQFKILPKKSPELEWDTGVCNSIHISHETADCNSRFQFDRQRNQWLFSVNMTLVWWVSVSFTLNSDRFVLWQSHVTF